MASEIEMVKLQNKGIGLIISMEDLDPTTLRLRSQYGRADVPDVGSMLNMLNCDYTVIDNPTSTELVVKVDELVMTVNRSNTNNQKKYQFVCVFYIGHGNRNQDGPEYLSLRENTTLTVEGLFQKFSAGNCPGLIGDLKAFILQACRGDHIDTPVARAAASPTTNVSQFSDFYVLQPSFFGHYSFYNSSTGKSEFIQNVCDVFTRHYQTLDIHDMGMIVKKNLSGRSIRVLLPDGTTRNCCHTITEINTLTKKVFFPSQRSSPLPQIVNPIDNTDQRGPQVFVDLAYQNSYLGRVIVQLDEAQYPRRRQHFLSLMKGDNPQGHCYKGTTFTDVYSNSYGEGVHCEYYLTGPGTGSGISSSGGGGQQQQQQQQRSYKPLYDIEDHGPDRVWQAGDLLGHWGQVAGFYICARTGDSTDIRGNPLLGTVTEGLDIVQAIARQGWAYAKAVTLSDCGQV